MNLTSITEVNGKKLTKPQMNLLSLLETKYKVNIDPVRHANAINPMSGVSVSCTPLIGCLCEVVHVVYKTYGFDGSMTLNGERVTIQTFDRIRHLILALDSHAYSNVID
jgi:hypothetical protein